ncbi:MAG: glycosyltransferase family 4 protein [Micromonosporaceae bacterium]|nr:glycosyltransferase family 4 protein [Micromonosporaceae bacterium]
MLSWEYPPVMVGGLGRHVVALSRALAEAGHEVTVVTRHAAGAPLEEYIQGVRVVRAPEDPPLFPLSTPNLLAWTMAFNHAITRAALRAAETVRYDVIHAHDWLVTHTAVTLAEHLDLPMVATIHATEAGRHQGWLPGEMNKCIHSVEYWLTHEARRVITCSEYMRWEVTRLLELPSGRVQVVPNGVDSLQWRAAPRAVAAARARFAGEGPLLAYAGRLVYEKGVQDIVAALPELRYRHPGLRMVVAGDGPYRAELQEEARSNGLHRAVSFTGFLGEELPAVMAATDTLVVPSIYEPFGLVALEGASAGAPLAVASTGGLAEIVQQGVTGVTFPAKNPGALAEAVSTLLSDEAEARRMAGRAKRMVRERFGWDNVASLTADVYRGVLREAEGFDARQAEDVLGSRPTIVVPEGNLLEGVMS